MSTVDVALGTGSFDDAGARTADLYDWQAAMAAADGLAILKRHLDEDPSGLSPSDLRIICEHHEDWIVQLGTQMELVSAKHREPASGPWQSISALVTDGGLGHLFSRWCLLDRAPSIRLVTSAATASGEARDLAKCRSFLRRLSDGQVLSEAESERLVTCIDKLARSLMMYRKNLPTAWQAGEGARANTLEIATGLEEAVREFLFVLTIEDPRPGREFTHHAAPSLYVQPLLALMKQPEALASAVWQAVVQLFRARMRARGPSVNGGLPPVLSALDEYSFESTERMLETRVLTIQDISIAVRTALSNPGAYIPISHPTRLSKLGMKMAMGGCSDTSIERAERLRIDYARYRRERRNSVPGSRAEQPALERSLLRIADEETDMSRTAVSGWGSSLWSSLSRRLDVVPSSLSTLGLDGELALGGICDLTSRCQVWFSPRFDVDAAIATAAKNGLE